MRTLPILAVLALTGCATEQALLAPYQPPADCAAIDAEMAAIAKHDAKIYTLRGLKEGVAAEPSALTTGRLKAAAMAPFL